MNTHRLILPALLLPTLLLILTNRSAHAGSATWNLNPTSHEWNTTANWTPATIPNGPNDVATFDLTNRAIPHVGEGQDIEVDSVVFNPGASSYTIQEVPGYSIPTFTLSGAGFVNNSGISQSFEVQVNPASGPYFSTLVFTNNATAGVLTSITAFGGMIESTSSTAAIIFFFNSSSAASASITNLGGGAVNAQAAGTYFVDDATAANALIISGGGSRSNAFGALTFFGVNASGDHATLISNGATAANAYGGTTQFYATATAADATVMANGSSFGGSASAGVTQFLSGSTAGNASLIANGGTAQGGSIQFTADSSGGTARIELFGNGTLDISGHDSPGMISGSLEGDGLVFLGANILTIGSSSLSTTFSGIIQDSGSVTKTGDGTLTLSGANLFTGGTTVSVGSLVVSNTTGSATGTGTVQVNAGTLGGSGSISGAVTIGTGGGTGAFLAPATGTTKQTTLTIQGGLALQADATYSYTFKAKGRKARTDKVIANGVTINGASFAFQGTAQGTLKTGLILTAISNTAATPISGTFANLPDGAILTVNGNNFQANYEGGDGNDLTLTVVP